MDVYYSICRHQKHKNCKYMQKNIIACKWSRVHTNHSKRMQAKQWLHYHCHHPRVYEDDSPVNSHRKWRLVANKVWSIKVPQFMKWITFRTEALPHAILLEPSFPQIIHPLRSTQGDLYRNNMKNVSYENMIHCIKPNMVCIQAMQFISWVGQVECVKNEGKCEHWRALSDRLLCHNFTCLDDQYSSSRKPQ